jgi:hypothetical protein
LLAEAEEVEDEHADLIADILDTVGKIYRKPQFCLPTTSVADPDPGSIAFLTPGPGSGIRNRFFPDPGSRIPLSEFLGKKFYNSLKIGPNFFLRHLKNKIIFNFVIFVATKKGLATNFFDPSLLLLFLGPGSEIRDPEWVNIRIRDLG